jgi:hypothetical protein
MKIRFVPTVTEPAQQQEDVKEELPPARAVAQAPKPVSSGGQSSLIKGLKKPEPVVKSNAFDDYDPDANYNNQQ